MIELALLALITAQPGAGFCDGITPPAIESLRKAIHAKQYDSALKTLAPMESSHTRCWMVQVLLGRTRYEQGKYREAALASELAFLSAPEEFDVLLLRGQILLLKGEIAQAQEHLEKACKLRPANAEAYFQLGVLFDGKKRHAEAVETFRKVVRLRPSDARAWDYLALHLEMLGDSGNAEAAFQKGLAVNNGEFSDAYLDYNYGRLLYKMNRLEESRMRFDRALQVAPPTRAIHYERARVLLLMDRLTDARSDAEKALKLADQGGYILDLQVYNLLIQIYGRLGESGLAAKYVELSKSASVPLQGREFMQLIVCLRWDAVMRSTHFAHHL